MIPYLLLVAIGLSDGPLKIALGPLPFHSIEDCIEAASIAVAFSHDPVKAVCVDAATGEIQVVYEKGPPDAAHKDMIAPPGPRRPFEDGR